MCELWPTRTITISRLANSAVFLCGAAQLQSSSREANSWEVHLPTGDAIRTGYGQTEASERADSETEL